MYLSACLCLAGYVGSSQVELERLYRAVCLCVSVCFCVCVCIYVCVSLSLCLYLSVCVYRIESGGHRGGSFISGCADDGEIHAGSRMLHLLDVSISHISLVSLSVYLSLSVFHFTSDCISFINTIQS